MVVIVLCMTVGVLVSVTKAGGERAWWHESWFPTFVTPLLAAPPTPKDGRCGPDYWRDAATIGKLLKHQLGDVKILELRLGDEWADAFVVDPKRGDKAKVVEVDCDKIRSVKEVLFDGDAHTRPDLARLSVSLEGVNLRTEEMSREAERWFKVDVAGTGVTRIVLRGGATPVWRVYVYSLGSVDFDLAGHVIKVWDTRHNASP